MHCANDIHNSLLFSTEDDAYQFVLDLISGCQWTNSQVITVYDVCIEAQLDFDDNDITDELDWGWGVVELFSRFHVINIHDRYALYLPKPRPALYLYDRIEEGQIV